MAINHAPIAAHHDFNVLPTPDVDARRVADNRRKPQQMSAIQHRDVSDVMTHIVNSKILPRGPRRMINRLV